MPLLINEAYLPTHSSGHFPALGYSKLVRPCHSITLRSIQTVTWFIVNRTTQGLPGLITKDPLPTIKPGTHPRHYRNSKPSSPLPWDVLLSLDTWTHVRLIASGQPGASLSWDLWKKFILSTEELAPGNLLELDKGRTEMSSQCLNQVSQSHLSFGERGHLALAKIWGDCQGLSHSLE